ncbi:cardiolipin synthase [bacterium]|nr:cardiolipin synthase [bacterium]
MDLMSILVIGYNLYLLITIIFLILDNRETASTIAWIFLFVIFPVLGFILYMLIGRNWRKNPRSEQIIQHVLGSRLEKNFKPFIRQQEREMRKYAKLWRHPAYKRELMHLLYQSSHSLLSTQNQVRVFYAGRDKFSRLKQDLKNAKHFIHLEYFIWRADETTRAIKDILTAKARAGVEVRILYDFLGSIFLARKYLRELRRAGVRAYPFYNFLAPFKLHTMNYRNHRKIVVIDGKIGYTGGMNMGQEYIDGGKKFPSWRDTHLRLEGQVVAPLQAVFAIDWYNTTKEELFAPEYCLQTVSTRKVLPLQITTSGPDSEWPSIEQLYFCMINSAQKYVYIQSPYLVPSPSVYAALKTAVLRGLDVRINIAGLPDKKIPYWAAFTYFEDLLKAGLRIFHYQKGFLHAKTIAIDGVMCSIGTANMDLRSFRLNYELNLLIYDRHLTTGMKRQFLKDLKHSREFTLEDYYRLGYLRHFRNSLSRLLAPLL